MKFSIGDPVYVRSNDEEGVIEAFIGKEMASVLVEGRSYHAFLEDLEHPYLRWFMKGQPKRKSTTPSIDRIVPEKPGPREPALPTGIYILFMPVYHMQGFEDQIEKLRVYMHSALPTDCHFQYRLQIQGQILFEIESVLHSHQEFYVHDISFEDMARHPKFHFRFSDPLHPAREQGLEWSIKPKKLFTTLQELRYHNQPHFHHLLLSELREQPKKEVVLKHKPAPLPQQPNLVTQGLVTKSKRQGPMEVDLHIEKLTARPETLSAGEKLHMQLHVCQQSLDWALATHQHSLVLIHGVGRGVLKEEIIKLIHQTRGVHRYVNEYDSRYGYGATKVFFDH